ncbi:SMI1/KNR4 family protein, partial [Bacillus thuringiensis]|nr:SMI1/KNR4 family protein [Bacillus thuringiensis]
MATFDFIKNSHHKFFKLQENELIVAEERLGFTFPHELRNFYFEVGDGFIQGNNVDARNRLMEP